MSHVSWTTAESPLPFEPLSGLPTALVVVLGLIATLVVVTVVAVVFKGLTTWQRNNAAQVLSEPAMVVAKRAEVSAGNSDKATRTHHLVTFETSLGARHELAMHGADYGLLAEGDRGTLTFQGTRYQGFVRSNLADG